MTLATLNAAPSQDLKTRVELFLRQSDSRLARICVEAEGSVVRLVGSLPTYYLRTLAIAAAHRVAGVRQVEDRISVPAGDQNAASAAAFQPGA